MESLMGKRATLQTKREAGPCTLSRGIDCELWLISAS
jgi:hypothetical protein